MYHGLLAGHLGPSGAHGHAAAPITLGCWRGEGHGSPVDVGASVCLLREATRGRAADGMVVRRPWSAFSDVDRTQPSVRIVGCASGEIRGHKRRCRTRGLLQGPYRVADVVQPSLPSHIGEFTQQNYRNYDVHSTLDIFFSLRLVEVSFRSQSSLYKHTHKT